jgi:hypothetical protein
MTEKKLLLPALAGVLAVGLAGTAAFLEVSSDDGVDPGMVVVARQQATNFFSLDHRRADEDVDRVLALATGTFKKEYAAQREQIVKGVTDKKLVVTAEIPEDGAAVEFYDDDQARVLVAVDVTTTGSTASAEPTENRYRTRVLLTKVGDTWLVSGLNQVG